MLEKVTKDSKADLVADVSKLKHIDFETGKIPVGDKVLTIQSSLSVDKWIEFEKLSQTFSFGKDIEAVEKDLSLAYDFLNKTKFADAAVLISNLRLSIVRNLENKIHPAMELCLLFLAFEGEDVTHYHPELNNEKLEAIKKEGYAMEDFFTLASNLVRGYINAFEKISQSISQELAEVSEVIDNVK